MAFMPDRNMTVSEQVPVIVAAQLGCPREMVSSAAEFSELSGLDSLKLFSIINSLEYEYKITLNDDEVYQLTSVSDLVSLVERELDGGHDHGT
jgi:acyl carrier protein